MTEQRFIPIRRRPLTRCLLAVLAIGGMADAATATSHPQAMSSSAKGPDGSLSVTSCADDGTSGTLRSVVAAAVSGDSIDLTALDCGVITLVDGQIEVHVDDLTLDGPGQTVLAIDGNYGGRVFHHDGTGMLTISGLTIRHGVADASAGNPSELQAAWGGCILSSHDPESTGNLGAVALIASTVTGCRATSVPAGGMVFINGARGGGIMASSHVVLDHATISDNVASSPYGYIVLGGGIYTQSGGTELNVITASTISENRSESIYNAAAIYQGFTQGQGGGLRLGFDTSITDSLISNNFAGCDTASESCTHAAGGGIFALGNLTITTSVVADNVIEAGGLGSATLTGAGIRNIVVYATTISDSTITGNEARKPDSSSCFFCAGGGILVTERGDVQIVGSTIDHNVSPGSGGGVYGAYTHLTFTNSTISANSAAVGGAVYLTGLDGYDMDYPMTMRNSTVTSNSAANGGGIVDNHAPAGGSSDFESTIVAGNVNTDGNATYGADLASSQAGATIIGANNLIVEATDVTLPLDTISADPMLGPLQDNGGVTWTHALQSGSPAIDSGNNIGNLSFDQRGTGFPRVMGPAADIGAFEVQVGIPDAIFANGFDGASP